MPSEKYLYPRASSHWLHGSMHAPSRMPIATRPVGPIHLLSKAYFTPREIAMRSATMPIRENHRPAIRFSMSMGADLCARGIFWGVLGATFNGGAPGPERGAVET